MHLLLDKAVFSPKSQAEALALVDMFTTAALDSGKHALVTDPALAADGSVEAWLATQSHQLASAFRILLAQGPLIASGARNQPASDTTHPRHWNFPGALAVRVERRTFSDWSNRLLNVEDAAQLMREPLHLVLENERTDLAFVRFLAGPTNGKLLRERLDQPARISPHGGGGGEAKKWIEDLVEGAPTPVKWRRMLRTWVLG